MSGPATLIGPEDEEVHASENVWHCEGSWFAFHLGEQGLAGWFYHLFRPNLGLASGGVWVFDPTTTVCFEAPYFLNLTLQPVPRNLTLTNVTWPDGSRQSAVGDLLEEEIRMPGAFRLEYEDGDALGLDLTYVPVNPPWVTSRGDPPVAYRFEQLCRVTGTLVVHGRSSQVDCLSLRDHSWGPRPESSAIRGKPPVGDIEALSSRPVVYFYGAASPSDAFFVTTYAPGFLLRDGQRQALVDARQEIHRDQRTGAITDITVTMSDVIGRQSVAVGHVLSHIMRPAGSQLSLLHHVAWTLDGMPGWGDLQDVWPVDLWSACRRSQRAG